MKTGNISRKPEWLRKKISFSAQKEMDQLLNDSGIHTICQEAKCPNISECFKNKNATFLIKTLSLIQRIIQNVKLLPKIS